MMIGALSRRQKVYVWREFEQKRAQAWEKRERKKRERRVLEKEAHKKRWKNSRFAPFCLLPSREQNKGKRAKVLCRARKIVPFWTRLFILFLSPQQTTQSHDTPRNNYTRMTDSKRSNAAGEKYALRGIYGSEPYWPQEKLKICVTGAGGFIGETY